MALGHGKFCREYSLAIRTDLRILGVVQKKSALDVHVELVRKVVLLPFFGTHLLLFVEFKQLVKWIVLARAHDHDLLSVLHQ